jgi:hypothetical protein
VFCVCPYLYCFVVILLFCFVIVVLCIFIFVCTSVGLLPPGESPIAVVVVVIIIIIIIIIIISFNLITHGFGNSEFCHPFVVISYLFFSVCILIK